MPRSCVYTCADRGIGIIGYDRVHQEVVDALRDGTIDALFWSGGLPTPGITDLFTTAGDQVRFIDITPLLPELQEINPVYEEGEIAEDIHDTPFRSAAGLESTPIIR